MRYKIDFSYDGTNYNGYQFQPGLRTIQNELEKAVSYLNRQQKTIVASSGRTDKGVHAISQIAHFDLNVEIPLDKIKRGLNSILPDDIHINSVKPISKNFHARFDSKKKQYLYLINTGEYNPMMRNYIYQYNKLLDINKMKEAIKLFEGTNDYRSFIASEDKRENSVRTIYKTSITEKKKIISITFTANGFMQNQVRNMVGLLIDIGKGRKQVSDVEIILKAKDRKKSSVTAPAEGLYLKKVSY